VTQDNVAAFLTTAAQLPLGTLPEGTFSQANGASRRQIVGYSSTGHLALRTHAFVWDARHGLADLGTLGDPELFSAATAVNDTATVAGYGTHPDVDAVVPVVWAGRHIAQLETLGGLSGFGSAMNSEGVIVGESQVASGTFHATLWDLDGVPLDLSPLGQAGTSSARAISDDGDVVGMWQSPAGLRGFLWTQALGMVALSPLPGDVVSQALGVSPDGTVVVGQSMAAGLGFPPPLPHAVLWEHGQAVSLASLVVQGGEGWQLTRAVAVTESGAVVGQGQVDGQQRGFALVPVPQGDVGCRGVTRRLVCR
jgi:probable HAF family extracellular repeat protein